MDTFVDDISGRPCDPKSFYNDGSFMNQMEEKYYENVIFAITCTFQVLSAPFLVIMPFLNSRLNTTTRKVIAMIVLSDFGYSILCLEAMIAHLTGQGPKADPICLAVTFAYDTFVTCSLIWTFLLLVNIYIHSAHIQTMPTTRRLFVIYNCISWPLGALLSFPAYFEAQKYPVTYRTNYLFDVGCHLNFTFSKDDNDCLIDEDGEYALGFYYSIRSVIILMIWVLFFLSVRRAHLNWVKSKKASCGTQSSKSTNSGHKVAQDVAYKSYRNCLKFVVPAFVYSAAFVPIFFKKLYGIEYGAIENPYVRAAYVIWFAWSGLFVACMNVMFYGFGSALFREEVCRLWHHMKLLYDVRLRNRNNGASSWNLQEARATIHGVNGFLSESESSSSASFFTETELDY